MTKAVIYARYSSDNQKESSIEDQIRICKERIEQQNWQFTMPYSDYAISGTTMQRAGLQALMRDAASGEFNIVVTEGLDRMSRDQEDIAGIYKRLTFQGVKIYSLSDGGFVSDIHIGLKGTMNALFVKDLARKIKRGQRGRIESGKSIGKNAYGYDVVKGFDSKGELIRGERTINQEQAAIIRRIMAEYAAGHPPHKIAMRLNEENAPAPSSKGWSANSIIGYRNRGSGILNNALYNGQLVWNRASSSKCPDTGKRVERINSSDQWVITEVPELRIVEQELWDKVKARQEVLAKKFTAQAKRRPKQLLSFLLKCGCCGGGYSKVSATRYGCTNARKRGSCDNRLTIAQTRLEQMILNHLKTDLMKEEWFEEFMDAYQHHIKQSLNDTKSDTERIKAKLVKLEADKANLIEAIKQGIPASEIKDELAAISEQKQTLECKMLEKPAKPEQLSPDLATRYQDILNNLHSLITREENLTEAATIIRKLIDKIEILPDNGGHKKKLKVNLYGDLAGMIALSSNASPQAEQRLRENFAQLAPLYPKKQELQSSLEQRMEQLPRSLRPVFNVNWYYWLMDEPPYDILRRKDGVAIHP